MSTAAPDPETAIGIVAIGRNEGERLRRCLLALGPRVRDAVYVDSGSTDGSVALARAAGTAVVELARDQPFTAARARNAGFAALAERSHREFVQFVDGDCELAPEWLAAATAAMRADQRLAVVFGRRRERHRSDSRWNRLCDLEWDVPIGEALACGGDALMRTAAFRTVGGYDGERIAGEEPDLCRRLRAAGWRIRRIDAPMTTHDAAMRHVGQWWRRSVRAGYVEAEGVAEHGRSYERWRAARSNLFWVVALPVTVVAVIVAAAASGVWLLAVAAIATALALHAVAWLRIFTRSRARWGNADARLWATFCLLGKWPATQGMATYVWRRLGRRRRTLIEYKAGADA
jgi:GT2 family glycosyltransferase